MTVTEIIRRRGRDRRRTSSPPRQSPSGLRPQAIITRAEQAECTCPEHCERDHEQD